jgi:pimeloyl-ACP methyl ester carboxylesterase
LFGHSEGGALAVVLAGRRSDVAAVVVAASASFPIDELLHEQLASNPTLRQEVATFLSQIRSGSFPDGGVLLGACRDYWMQWIDFTSNMGGYLRKFSAPVLVLQGTADTSLPGSTLERNISTWRSLASDRRDMAIKIYPGVDHLLIDFSTQQLSDGVARDTAEFFLQTKKRNNQTQEPISTAGPSLTLGKN